MAVRDAFKVSRKTFLDPGRWLDVDSLASMNKLFSFTLRTMATPEKATQEETFEEAMQRLALSEQDIHAGIKSYRRLALTFFLLGLAIFYYGFYLVFSQFKYFSWLLAFSAAALFFVQAFKYDFWALQMRQRKLGLTFRDWQNDKLGKGEKS